MTIDNKVLEAAQYWSTASVFTPETRSEISALVQKGDYKELTDRFYRDLEFGTGGMRGILGAGTNRMNVYNIRKATTALAQYMKASFPKNKELKIGVSHDSRKFSREFAKTVCEVMAAHGIKSVITRELRPVPMLSFLVRHFGCQSGVCITASHNPPNYNGYKVYWETGGQLIPPHDKNIIKLYNEMRGYESLTSLPYDHAMAQGMVQEVGEELDAPYFEKVRALSLQKSGRENFKVVYSPIHGTGFYPVPKALSQWGFNDVTMVPEQAKPDGAFPTVKFPNPEDPAALVMAIDLAKKTKADMVIATDPDCDRLGMAVREGEDYWFLNGNEMGSLLTEYVLSSLRELGRMPTSPLFVKTIVTTDLQNDIAQHYGVHCEETLTGFKWICQVIDEYEKGIRQPYRKYVCGGEESYGFLTDSFVRDKDGVTASCMAVEMVAYYKSKGISLRQALDKIFLRHGVYHESLHTVTLPGKDGAEAIDRMMQRLRKDPPRLIDGVPVAKVRDFEFSQEYLVTNSGLNPSTSLTLPKSNVLQFILEDGTKVSARPSGTEPKIKFYVSVREGIPAGKDATAIDADLKSKKARCQQRVKKIEETFVQLASQ